jgi:PEP-CTERM motif
MRGFRSVVLAALSGVALVGFMASAQAVGVVVTTSGDIVTLTFTGTVGSSQDLDGTFGCNSETSDCSSDGNPYDGYSYTAVYTFNTGLGYLQNNSAGISATGGTSQPTDISFGGPPPQPPPSPLISDTVTFSGGTPDTTFTESVDVSYNALIGVASDPANMLTASVNDSNGDSLISQVTSSEIPFSITTPFGPIDLGENAGLSTYSFDCTTVSNVTACDGFITADLTVSLTNASLTVPEPSTWVMMSVGFAGLAFAGYRRTRTAALVS